MLERAGREAPFQVVAVRHPENRGRAQARETGWRESRAELIAFTDDDCVPEPGWLEAGIAAAEAASGAIVQGATRPDRTQLDRLGPFARTVTVESFDPAFQTCNMFFPRAVLEGVGGFDVESFGRVHGGEDSDLAWRAIKAGAPAAFAPDARVEHAVDGLGARRHPPRLRRVVAPRIRPPSGASPRSFRERRLLEAHPPLALRRAPGAPAPAEAVAAAPVARRSRGSARCARAGSSWVADSSWRRSTRPATRPRWPRRFATAPGTGASCSERLGARGLNERRELRRLGADVAGDEDVGAAPRAHLRPLVGRQREQLPDRAGERLGRHPARRASPTPVRPAPAGRPRRRRRREPPSPAPPSPPPASRRDRRGGDHRRHREQVGALEQVAHGLGPPGIDDPGALPQARRR